MVTVKVYLLRCGGDRAVEVAKEAILQSGIEAQMKIITDLNEAAKAGVFSTIAIKINNRIAANGRIPTVQELVTLLTDAAGR